MKVVFFGSSDFAVPALEAIVASDWELLAVVTEPTKPKGRSRRPAPTPLGAFARAGGLPLREVATWKDEAERAWLRSLAPDLLVTAAYGRILPRAVREAARHGAVNLHASLLPRWRGAAPVQRAIEAGDEETGVTIFRMDGGVDTGEVLAAFPYRIPDGARADEVLAALAALAAENLVSTIEAWRRGEIVPRPQQGEATYAERMRKEEGRRDWNEPAEALARRVRAFYPWPIVTLPLGAERTQILRAEAVEGEGAPGEVVSVDPFVVACGAGALRIDEARRPGRKAVPGSALARGLRPAPQ